MIKRIVTGLIGIWILPLGLWAQATATAELSTTTILIGDQVNLQIRVSREQDAQVDINFSPLDSLEGIEVVKVGDPVTKKDGALHYLERNITLTSFDTGAYLIPQIPVTFLQNGNPVEVLQTNPIPLTVRSIPNLGEKVALNPIKDIEREAFTFRDALPYLLGVAALATIAFLIWWFGFRKPEEPEAIPEYLMKIHELALKKLDILEEQKLWQQGKVKDYYSKLTHIAREYLEYRYRIPALESTTGEILRQVQAAENIDAGLRQQLQHILTASDMVKFAKAEPAATFHTEALNLTRSFIETTKDEAAEPIPVWMQQHVSLSDYKEILLDHPDS